MIGACRGRAMAAGLIDAIGDLGAGATTPVARLDEASATLESRLMTTGPARAAKGP